jgi:hypothetical protein
LLSWRHRLGNDACSGQFVFDADSPALEEACKLCPTFKRVVGGFGVVVVARKLGVLMAHHASNPMTSGWLIFC